MASLLRTSRDLRTNALSGEETPWQMLDRRRAEQESILGSCSLMSGAILPRVSRALTASPPHREQIHKTRNLQWGGRKCVVKANYDMGKGKVVYATLINIHSVPLQFLLLHS